MPRKPSRKARWVADPDSDGGGKDDTLGGKDPLEELLKREASICKTRHYLHDPATLSPLRFIVASTREIE